MWPDGLIVVEYFGHLLQWKLVQAKKLPKLVKNLPKTFKICQEQQNVAKSGHTVWHWCVLIFWYCARNFAKFCRFDNFLGLCSNWQILYDWWYLNFCKWLNIKQIMQASGHTTAEQKPPYLSAFHGSVTSGQSYKASTIVIYYSRVKLDLKIPHITTLDS